MKKVRSWSKRTWILLGVLVVVLVLAVSCFATGNSGPRVVPPTDYQPVAREDIESRVSVTGTVEPKNVTNVTTRLTGNIDKLMVKVGDQVQEGQVVAQVDTTDLERQLQSLRTQAANQELAEQQAEQQAAEQSIVQGEDGQYYLYDGEYLYDYDDYATPSALPGGAQAEFIPADYSSDASGWGGSDLTSEIENLQADINSSTLRATSDGVVVAVPGQEGAPAAGPVVSIGSAQQLVLRTTVNEADAGEVSTGDTVTFTTPSTGDREYTGKVVSASDVAAAESAPGAEGAGSAPAGTPEFGVEIDVTGSTEGLKIGSTARARILTEHEENKLAVPREAVYETATGEQAVLVITPAGVVEERTVTPGLTTDFHVEVTDGLEEGENVITRAEAYHDAVGQQVELGAGF